MTLAQSLNQTAHCSVLRRKARGLGVETLDQAIALAVDRGCRHYRDVVSATPPDVSPEELGDEELLILLLLGENPYQPSAIRVAAQLARAPGIRPRRLAFLARCERVERSLAHIARAGRDHDLEGSQFWGELLDGLSADEYRREPTLPHWSRFVSMPGIQRGRIPAPVEWLVPAR